MVRVHNLAVPWRKEAEPAATHRYKRLAESEGESAEGRVRKGYVPVLAGSGEGEMERFVLHVRLLKDPCIAELLEVAAREFGHGQHGVLRIPCDVQHFRRVVDVASKA